MIVNGKLIMPAPGCVLRRKSDGLVRYGVTRLGKTFRIGDKILEEGLDEQPDDYEDGIEVEIAGNQMVITKTDSYDAFVSELIHARYSQDAEVALINNALEDIAGIADNTEYQEYQSWRAKCKSTAKQYLGL